MNFPRRLRGRTGISFGDRVRVDSHGWIEAIHCYGAQRFRPRIAIARDVAIGRHVTITAVNDISIGEGCLLSEGVYISDHFHDVMTAGTSPLVERPLVERGAVHIGPRCFIGFRACVLPGVTLGEGCVVGAQAVVTRSFPAGSVLAGSPARLLRTLSMEPLRGHQNP